MDKYEWDVALVDSLDSDVGVGRFMYGEKLPDVPSKHKSIGVEKAAY